MSPDYSAMNGRGVNATKMFAECCGFQVTRADATEYLSRIVFRLMVRGRGSRQ